jgi:hypothetical protein
MDNVLTKVRAIAWQHETTIILFFIGIAALLAFAFVREILSALYVLRALRARRARQPPEENPTANLGHDTKPPAATLHDEMARRDRDLEKWREEHKGQLEP